jgi:hypothetical protein
VAVGGGGRQEGGEGEVGSRHFSEWLICLREDVKMK